jgi:uncharacterized protein
MAMDERFADHAVVRRMLWDAETWAFVGLSDNPTRTVYSQAQLLQQRGKKIIPVHPDAAPVLGEQAYPSLAEVPVPIDVVGVYRRSSAAGEVVDEAIRVGAKGVWLPLDVIDVAAAERARKAGLDVVMDRCPGVEWSLRHRR